MPIITQSLSRLFEESTKCKRLNVAKMHTFPVITHYSASDCEKYQGYAEKILNCSNDLKMRVSTEVDLKGVSVRSSMENARWCRVRQCPMCGFARSSKMRAKLFKAFTNYELDPDSYSFLTLTVQNCPLSNLRQTLAEMNSAWDKLSRRRTFPIVGFLRSMEVTMQRDRLPGDKKKNTGPPSRTPDGELLAHPHFHIVLHTEKDFDRHLKDKQWLISLWTDSLRASYRPTIQIDKIRPSRGDFEVALLETCKYTVKPGDFSDDAPPKKPAKTSNLKPVVIPPVHGAEWLYGITEQLHNLRAVRLGGSFAKICSQAELDKIDDSVETDEQASQVGELLRLTWNDARARFDVCQIDSDQNQYVTLGD